MQYLIHSFQGNHIKSNRNIFCLDLNTSPSFKEFGPGKIFLVCLFFKGDCHSSDSVSERPTANYKIQIQFQKTDLDLHMNKDDSDTLLTASFPQPQEGNCMP